MLLPVIDSIVTDEDLAVPRSVNFDARVSLPRADRSHVAEEHTASSTPENLAGAGMVRRKIAERFRRAARLDERLDDPERAPRLGAAWLQHQRCFQRDRRHPQRVDAGGVAGENNTQ